jgi:hypothetical protein
LERGNGYVPSSLSKAELFDCGGDKRKNGRDENEKEERERKE